MGWGLAFGGGICSAVYGASYSVIKVLGLI